MTHRRPRLACSFAGALLLILACWSVACGARVRTRRHRNGAPAATAAGFAVLAQGGNAFDAAVAISAALAVVEPAGSGLGGGGFWLLHRAVDARTVMVDGRERAPLAATADLYLDERVGFRRAAPRTARSRRPFPASPPPWRIWRRTTAACRWP